MRRRTLDGLMQSYGKYEPVNLAWFKENHTEVFETVMGFYSREEHYEEADLMCAKQEAIDIKYFAYWCVGKLPIILEVKDRYSWAELQVISLKTGIALEHFHDYIEAVQ